MKMGEKNCFVISISSSSPKEFQNYEPILYAFGSQNTETNGCLEKKHTQIWELFFCFNIFEEKGNSGWKQNLLDFVPIQPGEEA